MPKKTSCYKQYASNVCDVRNAEVWQGLSTCDLFAVVSCRLGASKKGISSTRGATEASRAASACGGPKHTTLKHKRCPNYHNQELDADITTTRCQQPMRTHGVYPVDDRIVANHVSLHAKQLMLDDGWHGVPLNDLQSLDAAACLLVKLPRDIDRVTSSDRRLRPTMAKVVPPSSTTCCYKRSSSSSSPPQTIYKENVEANATGIPG